MVKRYPSEEQADISRLGRPLHFEFSGRTAPNRFMKAAMTERLSSWSPTDLPARGVPSPELINVYRRWGEGGFGVVLTGNIMMAYDQLEASGNMVVPGDAPFEGERFDAFRRLAEAGKAHGALVIGQVSHPGRQTEQRLQPDPVSASDVQLKGDSMGGMVFAKPHAASLDEIAHIIELFTHTAVYLAKAGYDGIQLHGAHGYLLAQFLSQTTNKRTDQYGGSIENRARLIVEIARSIRHALPPSSSTKFVLGIKINSVEFQADGFAPDEARQLCQILEENEFDFVELSGGTYEKFGFVHQRESSIRREAFFLDFADSIVPGLKRTKTYVTGGFHTGSGMVRALDTVDGIGLGRPATQEFHLPKDLLDGKVEAAIEPLIDTQNFGLSAAASGVQMRQVGTGQNPLDLSDPKSVEIFQKSLGEWMMKLKEDAGSNSLYGYASVPEGNGMVYVE